MHVPKQRTGRGKSSRGRSKIYKWELAKKEPQNNNNKKTQTNQPKNKQTKKPPKNKNPQPPKKIKKKQKQNPEKNPKTTNILEISPAPESTAGLDSHELTCEMLSDESPVSSGLALANQRETKAHTCCNLTAHRYFR